MPRKHDPYDQSRLYGDARLYDWASNYISPFIKGERGDGVVLAYNHNSLDQGTPWCINELKGHALTFSITRSGKGTDVIIPALLTYRGSCLVIDPKGENAWITADARRRMGQRVAIIDPWDQVNKSYGSLVGVRETVTRWNPLSSLNPGSSTFVDNIALLSEALVLTGNSNDPHWPESAKELIGGLIAAVVEGQPGEADLGHMRRLLTSSSTELIDRIKFICQARPNSLGARKLARFLVDSKEIASIRSTAQTQTAVLDSLALIDSLQSDVNGFDLIDLVRTRATVYLVIPAGKLRSHGRWLRMVVNMAISAIVESGHRSSTMPCLFLLDELGTISPGSGLPMLETSFGLMSGLGIRIWGFFQDINQLAYDYPHSWKSFIGNSSIKQVMRTNEPETAKYFSEYMGTRTVYLGNGSYAPRPLLNPQEIMGIPAHHCILLLEGAMNIKGRGIPYYEEPRYSGRYRPDPNYPPPAAVPSPLLRKAPPLPGWGEWAAGMRDKGVAAGSAAAAFASDWVKRQQEKQKQARADAQRTSGNTSDRERWAQTLRDAKGPGE